MSEKKCQHNLKMSFERLKQLVAPQVPHVPDLDHMLDIVYEKNMGTLTARLQGSEVHDDDGAVCLGYLSTLRGFKVHRDVVVTKDGEIVRDLRNAIFEAVTLARYRNDRRKRSLTVVLAVLAIAIVVFGAVRLMHKRKRKELKGEITASLLPTPEKIAARPSNKTMAGIVVVLMCVLVGMKGLYAMDGEASLLAALKHPTKVSELMRRDQRTSGSHNKRLVRLLEATTTAAEARRVLYRHSNMLVLRWIVRPDGTFRQRDDILRAVRVYENY